MAWRHNAPLNEWGFSLLTDTSFHISNLKIKQPRRIKANVLRESTRKKQSKHSKTLYIILAACDMLEWSILTLHWRHNDRDGVSNYQPYECLLNCLFRRRSKKTSKLRVTGLCEGNSPGTDEFPAQMASNAENISILWRHHVKPWPSICNMNPHSLVASIARLFHSPLTQPQLSMAFKNIPVTWAYSVLHLTLNPLQLKLPIYV